MKIDKSIGIWVEDTTCLDDIAYLLYIQYLKNNYEFEGYRIPVGSYSSQKIFLRGYKNNNAFVINFYNDAKKIIRKEKVNKLNEYN